MNNMTLPGMAKGGAVLSACGLYRYALDRVWGDPSNRCLFVMLNPSKADAFDDDPTVGRCIGFARGFGHGALDVANFFGWRATHPRDLLKVRDPIGVDNDRHLLAAATKARTVICAWGNGSASASFRTLMDRRERDVLALLRAAGVTPMCLGFTDAGRPLHPLYQPANAVLVPMPGGLS